MCGISGVLTFSGAPNPEVARQLAVMNRLLAHRGPDAAAEWQDPTAAVGLAHRRLSIIDLSDNALQPMPGAGETCIVFNGEIYNYLELREGLAAGYPFRSRSDTECILAAYAKSGLDAVTSLRGMFAFALWDGARRRLFCARDRFGIKPFYYAVVGDLFIFASEPKALLPFLPDIDTDPDALAEYLTFQYTLGERTLFRHVRQLLPGHALTVEDGQVRTWRYWDVRYDIDLEHNQVYFERRLRELVDDSLRLHLRSDVPVASYVSGGVDSSLVSALASRYGISSGKGFHGKFARHPDYDESRYARTLTDACGLILYEADITAADFRDSIEDVIYHLDMPVAGPGSFPQYMVSRLAAQHVKVVLGGQGGDEIFGGYARYLVAYFEQCIKAAIDGTYRHGNFVVTIESIVPNLGSLREYKPLIQQAWSQGLFGPMDERYLRLIDRSADMTEEVDWSQLDRGRVLAAFRDIFNNERNVRREAYFDSMTHFDFKCLLPALLHVEDRMSMAHGLESRVPFLDHPLVEFAATVPASFKFPGGEAKHMLKSTFRRDLPEAIVDRRDKMGFPVPLKEWFEGDLKDWIHDVFSSGRARTRPFMRADATKAGIAGSGRFSRKVWGLLSLELWHQVFHDRAAEWRRMLR